MALSFANPRTFDDDDRQLLRALADQCAQALERARLYEAEREARAVAEQAIKSTTRLQFLAAELAEALTARASRAKSSLRKGSQASAQTPALYSC